MLKGQKINDEDSLASASESKPGLRHKNACAEDIIRSDVQFDMSHSKKVQGAPMSLSFHSNIRN